MKFDLVINDGRIFTPYGFVEASIGVEAGRIASITGAASELTADRIVDAHRNFVLPGLVDMHVHFRDPGAPEREDFETGTRSAAAGGVTTVAEMPNTKPSVTSVQTFNEKRRIIEKKTLVDFALVAGAGEITAEAILSMAKAGAAAFKTFMISRFKELSASDGQMLENFKVIARTGLPCLVHAENESIVTQGIQRARALGRIDPVAHAEFRPPVAEDEATIRSILFAQEASSKVHICHMTSKGAVDFLAWAKARGIRATGETSPNYLLLSSDAMRISGPYAKIDPPLRAPEHQLRLWQALRSGTLDAVASDHAPYTLEEKEIGWKDIFEAPSGGTGVEVTLPLMMDSVNKGMISPERLVEVVSTNPAKILGIYPHKGVISVGSDADFVIVDVKREFTIKGESLHSKQKRTPFEGRRVKGAPVSTILRGEILMENGDVFAKPGYGVFLSPLKPRLSVY